jgi:glutathione synthase/RimK-type ligase-like ATP-grasp enzyme
MARNIAVLWDAEVDWKGEKPFKKNHINTTYEYFSDLAAEKDSKVFIGRFEWYSEGELQKAYSFDGENWNKLENTEVDVVFDKYRFDDETIELKKEVEKRHPVLNSFELEQICKDKLKAYELFPESHPATREATRENVEEMLDKYGKVVVKPLTAHAGQGVEVIDSISAFEEEKVDVVQQFIDSNSGIEQLGIEGVHDLRVVVVNGEPVIAYVRQPDSGFIANVAQGGTMKFVSVDEVPEEAMEIVKNVLEVFEDHDSFVCGIDMIFDQDQKPWILELNSKPGMSFYEDEETKKWKEPYIKAVVKSLSEIS